VTRPHPTQALLEWPPSGFYIHDFYFYFFVLLVAIF
jgi:hypothetical protein